MNVGDLVKLKSGGRTMLVARVEGEEAECVQYDERTCTRGKFPVDELEIVDVVDFCMGVTRTYLE